MRLYGQFTKVEEQADGTLEVEGVASSESVDADGETILASAMKAAIPDYMRFPALREMHQLRAAGRTLAADVNEDGKTRICAKVVDSEAVKKVKEGVYSGFSIGGRATKRKADDRSVIEELSLVEISLVDRPTNPDAVISLWKAEAMPDLNDRPLTKMTPILAAFSKGKLSADDAEQQLLEVLKVADRKDVSPEEGKEKYGDVEFADAKNKKYPIDTAAHVRAAWNYINKPANAGKYSSEDAAAIKRRIVAAWKSKIDKDGPPSAKEDKANGGGGPDGIAKADGASGIADDCRSCAEMCTECARNCVDGAATTDWHGYRCAEAVVACIACARACLACADALEEADEDTKAATAELRKGLDTLVAAAEAAKVIEKAAPAAKETPVEPEKRTAEPPKTDLEKALAKHQEVLAEELAKARKEREESLAAQAAGHDVLRNAMDANAESQKRLADAKDQTVKLEDAVGEMTKAVQAEIAKLRAEADELRKANAAALGESKKLLEQSKANADRLMQELAKRPKGILRSIPVSKAADNGTEPAPTEPKDPKDPVEVLKAVHAAGPDLDLTTKLLTARGRE